MERRQFCFLKAWSCCGVAVLVACIAGCGSGIDDAPETFEISGYVNFDGEPVPFGQVLFTNEATGYRSACKIEDGYYETQDRKGHQGGKFDVQIQGFVNEGEGFSEGPRLWRGAWKTSVELPAESVEKNFEISSDDVDAVTNADPSGET